MKFHLTGTWPTIENVQNLSGNEASQLFKKITLDGILKEISRVMNNPHDGMDNCGGVGHVVLLSICSSILTISSYVIDDDTLISNGNNHKGIEGKRFKHFIRTFFPEEYKSLSDKLYGAFRCPVTKEWNLFYSRITGIRNDKNHLKDENGVISISLYDFYQGLEIAIQNCIESIKNDKNVKLTFLTKYSKLQKRVSQSNI